MLLRRILAFALLLASLFAASSMKTSAGPWPPECGIWDICD